MKLKKIAALLAMLALMAVLPVFAATYPLTVRFTSSVLSVSFPTAADTTVGDQGVETEQSQGQNEDKTLNYTKTMYSVTLPREEAFYGAAYFDYTGGTLEGGPSALDHAIDGALKGGNFTEIPDARENTQLGGLYAKESVGTTDALDAFVRVAILGNRMFIVVIVADKDKHVTQSEADVYFNSLSRN